MKGMCERWKCVCVRETPKAERTQIRLRRKGNGDMWQRKKWGGKRSIYMWDENGNWGTDRKWENVSNG